MKSRGWFARRAKRSTDFLRPMAERRVGVTVGPVMEDQYPRPSPVASDGKGVCAAG